MVRARIRIDIYIYTLDKDARVFTRAVGFIWTVQCMYAFARVS